MLNIETLITTDNTLDVFPCAFSSGKCFMHALKTEIDKKNMILIFSVTLF